MTAVQLVVTGDSEQRGLHVALKRLFGSVTFRKPARVNSVTSNPLPAVPVVHDEHPAVLFARRALKALDDGDLVIMVDDLEQANRHAPATVIETMRRAVAHEATRSQPGAAARTRLLASIQQKLSFHLLAPMLEAYFFTSSTALESAGMPTGTSWRLAHPRLEDFETDDPGFLTSPQGTRSPTAPAWVEPHCHPKRYLDHLSRQAYSETEHARRGLPAVIWPSLVNQVGTAFLSSLSADIADAVGAANPLTQAPHALTYPSRTVNRATLLLRNL